MRNNKIMLIKYACLLALIMFINCQTSLTTSSTMTIKLKDNGLLYANPGIVIDFLIDPPVVRTQDQV
jgi:hypothetical protein